MHSWNMGYSTDTNYNYDYFGQINPYILRFNFLSQGLAFPQLGPNTNACELGFGNGISIIMHAAGSPVNWYGNDFNPSQVNYAKLLAEKGNVKLHITDDAFDQFLENEDLPMFDYICLHGIYSWISEENQDIIFEFVKRKLKVGGVLYISYNTGPGFSYIEPFRYLLSSYANTLGDPSKNHVDIVPDAIDFISKLLELKPGYTKTAPWAVDHYKMRVVEANRNYVGHEFFNGHWFLLHFNQVADKFEKAKLSFACQARLIDNLEDIVLTKEERDVLEPYKNTNLHQPVRDFIASQTFRADVFVKGLVQLSPRQQMAQLDEIHFILNQYYKLDEFTIKTRLGSHTVDLKRIKNVMRFLSDYKIHSFKEMRESLTIEYDNGALKSKNAIPRVPFDEFFSSVVYAVATGMIMLAVDPSTISQEIIDRCKTINAYILDGNQSESISALASPVVSGGVYVEDIDKILINMYLKIKGISERELSEALIDMITNSEYSIITLKGVDIKDIKELKSKIREFVHEFLCFKIPVYKSMMII